MARPLGVAEMGCVCVCVFVIKKSNAFAVFALHMCLHSHYGGHFGRDPIIENSTGLTSSNSQKRMRNCQFETDIKIFD